MPPPSVDKTFGDAVFTFTPTGGSGIGAITYESSASTVATISATSGEVTIGSAGTTTITATKAGDATYSEATASYTLNIAQAEQAAFTFADIADDAVDRTFGDPVFTFTPTGGSGTGAITYESSVPDVATISTTSGEVIIKGAGTTIITAIKAADTNYNAATASYTLNIAQAEQEAFVFDNSAVDKTFGDPVFTFTPTGGSGAGAITWESGDTTVATVVSPSGEVTIKGAGTTIITATNVATNYNAAATTYTLSVAKANQVAFAFDNSDVDKTFGDPVFTFTPTGGSGAGAITYESSASAVATITTSGEVTIAGGGTATITATKAADINYNEAIATYTLNVAKANQAAFTFADIADAAVDKTFGDPVFTFTSTGGSGAGAITYGSDDPDVATVSATSGEVTIKSVGSTTITATKAADTAYNEATASYSLTVRDNQAKFSFTTVAVYKTVGDPVFTFTSTGGSGTGAITYKSRRPRRRHRICHQRRSNHPKRRHNPHHRHQSRRWHL